MSSSIRALERELGSDLFVRSTRQVELTEAGRALLPAAQRAVEAAEDGRDAVAGVRGLVRGQLAIGVIQSQTVGAISVPGLLARYHRRHPGVTLRLQHAGVASLVHRTADGELELAVVDLPLGPQAHRVRARPLGTESLLLGVAAHDPLANRSRVRLIDLTDRDFVDYRSDSSLRASIDRGCQAAGLRRRIACEVDTIADLVELVAPRPWRLAATARRDPDGRRTSARARNRPSIPRDLMLVTPLDRAPSPAAAAFLEYWTPIRRTRPEPLTAHELHSPVATIEACYGKLSHGR